MGFGASGYPNYGASGFSGNFMGGAGLNPAMMRTVGGAIDDLN